MFATEYSILKREYKGAFSPSSTNQGTRSLLTLLKWWLVADMPYPPEQMESIFRQLALPGAWAML
jgi:hypothetical protein